VTARYEKPDWLTKQVLNLLVALVTNLGLSVRGSRILAVRGRRSGQIRTTPVNPLEIAGVRYLVAPRGETEWVRNLRASESLGVTPRTSVGYCVPLLRRAGRLRVRTRRGGQVAPPLRAMYC
jgi:hypothetical protein